MGKRVRPHVNPLSIIEIFHFDGFGNDKPIFVDVGAFKGEFMEALAEQHPDHNFILFEIRRPIAEDLRKKFKVRDNCVVFHGDAGLNFRNILEPCIKEGALIKDIFINFPDPWFKDRHKKRRFVNEKFLQETSEWIQDETRLIFQTDQKPLFDETREVIAVSPVSQIKLFYESPYGLQTDWESAKIEEGNKIYRMEFQKPN